MMMEKDFGSSATEFSTALVDLINAAVTKATASLQTRIDRLEHAKSATTKSLADLERKVAERE